MIGSDDVMSFKMYRSLITIKAGYFEKAVLSNGHVHYEPQSIAFDSMSQEDFESLYSAALDVISKDIGATEREVEQQLIDFM